MRVECIGVAEPSANSPGEKASRMEAANSWRTTIRAIVLEYFQEDIDPILAFGFRLPSRIHG
jgi:hypothetical protein